MKEKEAAKRRRLAGLEGRRLDALSRRLRKGRRKKERRAGPVIAYAADVPTVVRQIVFETIKREYSDNSMDMLTPEADFSRDLGLDSLHLVELFAAIEQEFEIGISDDEAQCIQTVGQLSEYVEGVLNELESPTAIGAM